MRKVHYHKKPVSKKNSKLQSRVLETILAIAFYGGIVTYFVARVNQ